MQHHLVAAIEKRLRRRSAEPIRAAGDEHEGHSILLE